ncbi:MAG: YfcC family protein [Marinifilaceae bacterium]|jgi:uncharacterized ion transporter superfamily protein YfcC|nr:YfcC family protein [Marinifilaceae bacterium]
MFKKIPHTYVIVFFVIVFCAILTWLIPGGAYLRDADGGVIPGSFHNIDSVPQTWQILSSFFQGFVNQAEIIIFILMIGGAFWIMNATKSIDIGIYAFLNAAKKVENISFFKAIGVNNIILTLIMLLFSVFGAVFGMSEETIAFVIIFVPLAISMGYDSIVGVCLCFVAAGLGFAGAILNPFTIGIAQGLAKLPLFSGIEYRMFCWLVLNFVGIAYILRYANKVKKNPKTSVVYEDDAYWREKGEGDDIDKIELKTPIGAWISYVFLFVVLAIYSYYFQETTLNVGSSSMTLPIIPILAFVFLISGFFSLRKSAHFFIINLLLFTILFLIIGVMGYGWYVKKIAILFLTLGIFSGLSMGYSADKITKLFLEGAKDIMSASIIVGLAGGIIVILQDGKIIDTVLNNIAVSMEGFGKVASVSMMYLFQTLINILIPSGSAKAALTMPIMSQLSDLIEVSRQSTVMAFQFGDGFTNMLTPTSGVLLGVLGVAKIPYQKWVKWMMPFMVILVLLGLLLLFPTVLMELNGF